MITRTYTIHCLELGGLKAHVDKIDDQFDSEMHKTVTDEQDLFIDKRDVICVCSDEGRYEYAIRYRITEKSFSKSETNTLLSGKKDAGWLPTWNDVGGKPSTFAPSTHNHDGVYFKGDANNDIGKFDFQQTSDLFTNGFIMRNADGTGKIHFWADGGNYRFSTQIYDSPNNILTLDSSTVTAHKALVASINPSMGTQVGNRDYNDARYSLTAHTHSQYSLTTHTHDDRYYTESESDGKYLSRVGRNDITVASSTTDSLLHINATSNAGANATLLSGFISSNTSDRWFMRFEGTAGYTWTVSTDGTLRSGTIPWARLSDVPSYSLSSHNHNDLYNPSGGNALYNSIHVRAIGTPGTSVLSTANTSDHASVVRTHFRVDGSINYYTPNNTNGTIALRGVFSLNDSDEFWFGKSALILTNAHVGNATANTHALNRITADGRYSLSSHTHSEIWGKDGFTHDSNFYEKKIFAVSQNNTGSGQPINYCTTLHVGAGDVKRSFQIASSYSSANAFYIRSMWDNGNSGAGSWLGWERLITEVNGDARYAALVHNHDSVYSLSSHNHDSVYGKFNATNYWKYAQVIERSLTDNTILSRVPGDPNWRFFMDVDGKLEWRNGSDSTMRAKIWREGDNLNLQARSTIFLNSVTKVNNAFGVCRNGSSEQTFMGQNATNTSASNVFNYYYGATRQGHLRAYGSGLFTVHGDTRLLLSSGTTVDIDKPVVATGGMTMKGDLLLVANTTSRVARSIGIYQGYGDTANYPRHDSSISFGYYDGTENVQDWVIGMLYQGGSSTRTRFYISYNDGSGSIPSATYQAKFWWANKTIRFNDFVGIGGEASTSYSLKTYGGVSINGVLSLGMDAISGYGPDQTCSIQAVKHIQCLGAVYMLKGTATSGQTLFNVPASTESCWEITYWEGYNSHRRCKAMLVVGGNGGTNFSISYFFQSTSDVKIAYNTSTLNVSLDCPAGTHHFTVIRTY